MFCQLMDTASGPGRYMDVHGIQMHHTARPKVSAPFAQPKLQGLAQTNNRWSIVQGWLQPRPALPVSWVVESPASKSIETSKHVRLRPAARSSGPVVSMALSPSLPRGRLAVLPNTSHIANAWSCYSRVVLIHYYRMWNRHKSCSCSSFWP